MSRVDVSETEADFIEFEFPDETAAESADKLIMFTAHTSGTTRQLRITTETVENVRERLEAAGITWEESESSITEDDMWPEWPEDSDEGDSEPSDDPDEPDAEETDAPKP